MSRQTQRVKKLEKKLGNNRPWVMVMPKEEETEDWLRREAEQMFGRSDFDLVVFHPCASRTAHQFDFVEDPDALLKQIAREGRRIGDTAQSRNMTHQTERSGTDQEAS